MLEKYHRKFQTNDENLEFATGTLDDLIKEHIRLILLISAIISLLSTLHNDFGPNDTASYL